MAKATLLAHIVVTSTLVTVIAAQLLLQSVQAVAPRTVIARPAAGLAAWSVIAQGLGLGEASAV
jgi:hypothetical protein